MNDFANTSLQVNIMNTCEKLSDKELLDLSNYLAYGFLNEAMSETTEKVVDEFFGLANWFNFVKLEHEDRTNPKHFRNRPNFDLDQYRSIIMFYMTKRFAITIAKIESLEAKIKLNEVNEKLLKLKLKEAVINSLHEGVFDKVDGWGNISDVLVSEGLLRLEED